MLHNGAGTLQKENTIEASSAFEQHPVFQTETISVGRTALALLLETELLTIEYQVIDLKTSSGI